MLGVLAAARAGMDARLIEAAAVTVAQVGQSLLAQGQYASVEELSRAQRDKWRAEAKSVAVYEVQASLGLGQFEARELVGVACAPPGVRALVIGALDRAWVGWALVRAYWRRCAKLPMQAAQLVAEAMFGTDPGLAARERLDPEGELADRPWEHAAFRAALEREATRVEGQDVAGERARRRAAYAARNASVNAHDDGTGTLSITTDLVVLCAIHSRLDACARVLRKQGDPRTLAQLHSDVAAALLLHGTLPVPEAQDPEDLSEEQLARFVRVINARPDINVDLVIPWDTLTGSPTCPHCGHTWPTPGAEDDAEERTPGTGSDTSGRGYADPDVGRADVGGGDGVGDATDHNRGDATDHDHAAGTGDGQQTGRDTTNDAPGAAAGPAEPGPAWASGGHPGQACAQDVSDDPRTTGNTGLDHDHEDDRPRDTIRGDAGGEQSREDSARGDAGGEQPREDSAHAGRGVDGDGCRVPGQGCVGEVIGSTSMFITPGHARELALTCGSRFYRFLTSPADGRLVERSRTAYQPDADMRRQIIAADRYSRAPGSRIPAANCELDHVTPWAPHTDCGATPLRGAGAGAGAGGGSGTGHDPARCPDLACSMGLTTEANLAALNKRVHAFKTNRQLALSINARRDLTFTTLLGQTLTTRVHDYTQYTPPHATDPAQRPGHNLEDDPAGLVYRFAHGPGANDPGVRADIATRGPELSDAHDLANQALYAALVHRGTDAFLTGADDHPGATEHGGPLAGWMWISYTHRTTGARRTGTPPEHPSVHDILNHADHPDHASHPDRTDHAGHRDHATEDPSRNQSMPGTRGQTPSQNPSAQGKGERPTPSSRTSRGPWATPNDDPPPF